MPGDEVDGRSSDLAGVLRDFAQLLSDEHTVDDILEHLGDYCTRLLPVHGVGVLLRGAEGEIHVATANTAAGRIVEELEAELHEGPCTVTIETASQVVEPDLELAADRYPRFVPRALDAGVRSIHGFPMAVRTGPVGSLDVVSLEPLELSPMQMADAQMLADVAVVYLANRMRADESTALARQLQQALDSRVVIEQAKGKLAERHGIAVSDAFELLRRHARGSGRKIHDVAAALLDGELKL